MTTPRPDAETDTPDEDITDLGDRDDDDSGFGPGNDEVSTGTNLGQTTPDRATGLSAFND